jgi:glucosamine-6-phosphate deaminase
MIHTAHHTTVQIKVFPDSPSLGEAAANQAAKILQRTINTQGQARIVAATGASQFAFLEALTSKPYIDWLKVEMFHLDEYLGLSIEHPASFRKYLLERLIRKTGLTRYHLLDNEETARRIGRELQQAPIDVAFVGIGENGHLAFNDPPADFQTEEPYIVVELDAACRRQQVGEGWFASIEEVPTHAVSMSIRQILKAKAILCIAPELRKAPAVKACLEGEVSPDVPASILRTHPDTTMFLDQDSASLLSAEVR